MDLDAEYTTELSCIGDRGYGRGRGVSISLSMKSPCPVCSLARLKLPVFGIFNKRARVECDNCNSVFFSDLGMLIYVVFLLYCHVVVMALSIPIIGGFLSGGWGLALFCAFMLVASVFLPAAFLHVRRVRTMLAMD